MVNTHNDDNHNEAENNTNDVNFRRTYIVSIIEHVCNIDNQIVKFIRVDIVIVSFNRNIESVCLHRIVLVGTVILIISCYVLGEVLKVNVEMGSHANSHYEDLSIANE